MSKLNSFAIAILKWPVLWGSLASLGFYSLIDRGILQGDYVIRYFASHPVEYIAMTMFFVGIAAILIKSLDTMLQTTGLEQIKLGPPPVGGQSITEADHLLKRMEEVPWRLRKSYLARRLQDALQYVQRKGSADQLDNYLRHASDLDAERMHTSGALVRLIIWAIPILGFLGTVIGITLAIAQLNGEDLEKSLPLVIHGLKIAFDTTALALSLSIVLMFGLYLTDRFESQLISSVDTRVALELVGRFEQDDIASDPQAAAIRRMATTVIHATEELVERQTELWSAALQESQGRWNLAASESATQLKESLAEALDENLQHHAETIVAADRQLAESNQQHWDRVQQSLQKASEAAAKQQEELARQGDVLLKVVDATGQVKQLETTLNNNLSALAAAHNFEETVMSLSAAIGLLTTQLHGTPGGSPRVDLQSPKTSNAA